MSAEDGWAGLLQAQEEVGSLQTALAAANERITYLEEGLEIAEGQWLENRDACDAAENELAAANARAEAAERERDELRTTLDAQKSQMAIYKAGMQISLNAAKAVRYDLEHAEADWDEAVGLLREANAWQILGPGLDGWSLRQPAESELWNWSERYAAFLARLPSATEPEVRS